MEHLLFSYSVQQLFTFLLFSLILMELSQALLKHLKTMKF